MSLTIIVKPTDQDFYKDTQWERQAHGAILIDGQEVAHTLQCPHCGGHFQSRKRSGVRRTYCMNCSAVTCGGPNCINCTPWERQMEAIEKAASRCL